LHAQKLFDLDLPANAEIHVKPAWRFRRGDCSDEERTNPMDEARQTMMLFVSKARRREA
jgi:hypothetical protein